MISSILLSLTGLCAVGCNNTGEDSVSQLAVVPDSQATRLSSALLEIMANEQGNFKQGGYIVYDAQSDSIAVCDPHSFAIYSALKQGMEKGGATITIQSADPVGSGWVPVGTCNGNWTSALGLVNKIRKRIPADQAFEIHVEPQSNGTYKVWYRIVSQKRKIA